jgi:hypothetical protein
MAHLANISWHVSGATNDFDGDMMVKVLDGNEFVDFTQYNDKKSGNSG